MKGGTVQMRIKNVLCECIYWLSKITDPENQESLRAVKNKIATLVNEPMTESLQSRIWSWAIRCYRVEIISNLAERNYRFIEGALKLVQTCGCTKEEVLQLVDYVYSNPVGMVEQDVGQVIITFSTLCSARGVIMRDCGEAELAVIWENIDRIRANQELKPKIKIGKHSNVTEVIT